MQRERVRAKADYHVDVLRQFDIKRGVADVPEIMKLMMIHFISSQS